MIYRTISKDGVPYYIFKNPLKLYYWHMACAQSIWQITDVINHSMLPISKLSFSYLFLMIYNYACVCVNSCECTCARTCMSACTCTHTRTCTHAQMHTRKHAQTCMYMMTLNLYTDTCKHKCTYTGTHTRTHVCRSSHPCGAVFSRRRVVHPAHAHVGRMLVAHAGVHVEHRHTLHAPYPPSLARLTVSHPAAGAASA